MGTVYTTSADKYWVMSLTFYEQYRKAKARQDALYQDSGNFNINNIRNNYKIMCDLLQTVEANATAAIVFQALAIEAYVNLVCVYVLGEDVVYGEKEKKFRSIKIIEKLKIVGKKLGTPYPDEGKAKIEELQKKRHELVHQKPHRYCFQIQPFDYDHPEKNYVDIDAYFAETEFVYANIENEMRIYEELKENIRIMRNAKDELIDEIYKNNMQESSRQLFKSISSALIYGVDESN